MEAAIMRGFDSHQDGMFSYLSPADRVPPDHPLRPIKEMVNQALSDRWAEFQAMYAKVGRPSIAPEQLLRALLLQVLYTIRSERPFGSLRDGETFAISVQDPYVHIGELF